MIIKSNDEHRKSKDNFRTGSTNCTETSEYFSKNSIVYNNNRIHTAVMQHLDRLGKEFIIFPFVGEVNIIKQLKELQRTGKVIRLRDYSDLGLKARTVYDNIISLAYLADALHELDAGKLMRDDYTTQLANIIAYCEVSEVLLGDIPHYTDVEGVLRHRLQSIKKNEREIRANNFIWMFLADPHRRSIAALNRHIHAEVADTPSFVHFFRMVDQIDPIIAIWRYLHHYRLELSSNYGPFVDSMKDFFENPDTQQYRTEHDLIDKFPHTKILLDYLTNSDKAKEYAKTKTLNIDEKYQDVLRYLIEQVPLFHENEQSEKTTI